MTHDQWLLVGAGALLLGGVLLARWVAARFPIRDEDRDERP